MELIILCYIFHRWDRYSSQMSEPRYLEKDKYYYFEVVGNQYGGAWELGLGVKLHDSTYSGGRYDTDRERQRISIYSNIVREEHVS